MNADEYPGRDHKSVVIATYLANPMEDFIDDFNSLVNLKISFEISFRYGKLTYRPSEMVRISSS